MTKPIRVLVLEDNPADIELMLYELRKVGFSPEWRRVDNKADFATALEEQTFDVILADYQLPQFHAEQALELLNVSGKDVPLIIVTGSISEETAVQCIKLGAADYLLKDRMTRLGKAVQSVLEQKQIRHEKKTAENALVKANRAYKMLSEINRALVRIKDETALLREICRVIVETGGYGLAWVGYAENDDEKSIRPVAQHGYEEGFLQTLKITWADTEHGRGPTAQTIRTGQPVIDQNIKQATASQHWHTEAAKRGHASTAALPLREDQVTFGALNVYSSASNGFSEEDITLLMQLAEDTAYGIAALRSQVQRRAAEEALQLSEKKFRIIFHEALDVIMVIHENSERILEVNRAVERVLGYDETALVGKHFSMLFHTGLSGSLTDEVHNYGVVFDSHQCKRADGSICPMDLTATLMPWGEGRAILVTFRDVSERQAMQEELIKAELMRVELEKERDLLDLKERFISMVSHQFRTPLTVILSSNQLLENYYERLTPEKRTKYMQQIRQQVVYMNNLIDEVLIISKAQAGKLDFNPARFDLEQFCRTTFEQFLLTDEGQHRFIFESSGGLGQAYMDSKLLQHILYNLLSNALKYTPAGKRVWFKLRREEETAVIEISDEGIGIPVRAQDRLFQPFHRADNTGDIRGTGLGLAIVKDSVQAHQGTITFQSEEGKGSTFTIRLPITTSTDVRD